MLQEHLTLTVTVERPDYPRGAVVKVEVMFAGEPVAEDYDALPDADA